MPVTHPFDARKLQLVAHYVCWVGEEPLRLGPARLHRILWFAEQCAILATGTPLTGAVFTKRPSGVVCSRLGPALTALEQAGALAIRQDSHTLDDEQYFALSRPQLEMLTTEQISILDLCIWSVCWEQTGVPRQQAHEAVLAAARIGEEIPGDAAYAGLEAPIEDDDLAWALQQCSYVAGEPDHTELDEAGAVNPRILHAHAGLTWYLQRQSDAGRLLPGLQRPCYYYKQKGVGRADIPDIGVVYEVVRGVVRPRGYRFTFPDANGEESLIPPRGRA